MAANAKIVERPTGAKYSPFKETWQRLRRSPSGMIGLTILVVHLIIAVTSPLLVPYSPTKIDSKSLTQSPSSEHLFGTDSFGRDVLTRVLLGGRIAFLITLTAGALALTWGGLFGIVLGFVGGVIDEAMMRVVDALLALPSLFMYLLVISALGSSNTVLIVVLAIRSGISIVRIARSATLDFVARDFITAARARGERTWNVVLRELLPNVLDVLMVQWAMRWSWMLLSFSGLSFLGFGVTPPTPDWGLMIAENRTRLRMAPWASVFPMLALSTLVIGINLAADALAKAVGLDRSREAPV
jgi:peptide/nickel transport system permease protein